MNVEGLTNRYRIADVHRNGFGVFHFDFASNFFYARQIHWPFVNRTHVKIVDHRFARGAEIIRIGGSENDQRPVFTAGQSHQQRMVRVNGQVVANDGEVIDALEAAQINGLQIGIVANRQTPRQIFKFGGIK